MPPIMPTPFGARYAEMYDALYASKDYEGECDRIEAAFRAAGRGVRSVLDLGCGTGSHAILLARRGYEVCGVDRSADMLQAARRKSAGLGAHAPRLVQGDLQTIGLEQRFDACILMFAVLGYQTTDEEVTRSLGNAARHLEPGGVFVCDVWNGTAVVATGPSERMRTVPDGERRLVRWSSGTLEPGRNLCRVEIRQQLLAGERLVSETTETHLMRYFFPAELEALLAQAGLDVLEMTPFEDQDWGMFVAARRR